MSEWLSEWLLTVVGGFIVAVLTAVLTPLLPFLPQKSVLAGTLIVHEGNGSVVLIDATGQHAPQSIVLPARERAQSERDALDPGIRFVSIQSVSWDSKANEFIAASGDENTKASRFIIGRYTNTGAPIKWITQSQYTIEELTSDPSGRRLAVTEYLVGPHATRRAVIFNGTSNPAPLPAGTAGRMSWSRDGKWLAYHCFPVDGSPQLCRLNLSSHRQQTLNTGTLTNVQDPGVSPDGGKVAFVASSGSSAWVVMAMVDAKSGTLTVLDRSNQDKSYPQFDATGTYVAYLAGSTLRVLSLITGKSAALADLTTVPVGSTLEWVPDAFSEFGTV